MARPVGGKLYSPGGVQRQFGLDRNWSGGHLGGCQSQQLDRQHPGAAGRHSHHIGHGFRRPYQRGGHLEPGGRWHPQQYNQNRGDLHGTDRRDGLSLADPYGHRDRRYHPDATALLVVLGTPVIDPTELFPANVGSLYTAQVSVSGGLAPFTWAQTGGTLPPGIALGASTTAFTTVSGTPTTIGAYSFQLTVTDANKKIASVDLR